MKFFAMTMFMQRPKTYNYIDIGLWYIGISVYKASVYARKCFPTKVIFVGKRILTCYRRKTVDSTNI